LESSITGCHFRSFGCKRYVVQPLINPKMRCERPQNTEKSATQAQFAILVFFLLSLRAVDQARCPRSEPRTLRGTDLLWRLDHPAQEELATSRTAAHLTNSCARPRAAPGTCETAEPRGEPSPPVVAVARGAVPVHCTW